MPAPDALIQLVDRFQRNLASYTSPLYNEEQTRAEFIGPFFDLANLGWDVANRQGYAEPYKDVVSEGALKGKSGKATSEFPDYTFRIGGTTKFFVEAKKPSVDISNNAEAAYQLRRYAWSAKLPLSILTNFKEFAIYDCRSKPHHTDKASVARVNFLTFEEYAPHWNEITDVFSKQAILLGSFDKYAESTKGKRGTTEVDEEFLKEIEKWRELLARSLALHDKSLDAFDLNFAVQRTIDRIIFLRMSEDRGAEEYGQLKLIAENTRVYRHLLELFDQADQKYNSGIFHFNKEPNRSEPEDTLTPTLHFDDETLSEIILNLYYPKSPYAFSVLSIDILGQVYERFLGRVIRLTEGHHAKVEEKPEVRKAGGVYYTPSAIVQYLVRNTIGKVCEGRPPSEISNLRILDPACGSGSFLIAAYTFLLDYHLDWYVKAGPQKYQTQVYFGDDNEYHLTTKEKKRILLDHIFGVDKDSQAVEVTKLNLLLKVLEGERTETLEQQQKLFKERALPDLGRNIAWGNSLIDPSFNTQTVLFKDNNILPVGFDWKREFPTVFDEGGFTIIIGNPPYLMIEELPEEERAYFLKHYETYKQRYDAFGLFLERSVSLLNKNGMLGMIIPSTILNNLSFTKLRKYILDSTEITSIVNLGGKVFKNVNNDTLILLLSKTPTQSFDTEIFDVEKYGAGLSTAKRTGTINLPQASNPPTYTFQVRVTTDVSRIISKMESNSIPLGKICEAFQGLIAGNNDAFFVTPEEASAENLESTACKSVVFANDIERFGYPTPRYSIIYLTSQHRISDFPNIQRRLESFRAILNRRAEGGLRPWYSLHRPREARNFERNTKIFVQDIRNLALRRRIVATMDTRKLYADHTLSVIYSTDEAYDLKYVLGILNSKLVNYVFQHKYLDIHIKGIYLEELPIRRIDFHNPEDVAYYNNLIQLVTQMLTLKEKAIRNKGSQQQILLQRQLDSIDSQIDELVYDIYQMDQHEREIINASLQPPT